MYFYLEVVVPLWIVTVMNENEKLIFCFSLKNSYLMLTWDHSSCWYGNQAHWWDIHAHQDCRTQSYKAFRIYTLKNNVNFFLFFLFFIYVTWIDVSKISWMMFTFFSRVSLSCFINLSPSTCADIASSFSW